MPNHKPQTPVVAIFNSSEDLMEILQTYLQEQGIATITGHVPDIKRGEHDFVAFMEHHQPKVVIYDIPPPYDRNWTFFQLIQHLDVCHETQFVITTTNQHQLVAAGGSSEAIEIVGKPFDLDQIVNSVKKHL